MSDSQSTPLCPGCHFRCEITDYQCARGERLHQKWTAGEELPERRIPGAPAKDGVHKNIPRLISNDRLMHTLHIIEITLDELASEVGSDAPNRLVLDCLMRHEHAASSFVIQGRTQLHESELDALLGELENDGFIATRTPDNSVAFYELTEEGREKAGVWREERRAAEAELLSMLSDEEKAQLHELLFKVIKPGMKRRAQARIQR